MNSENLKELTIEDFIKNIKFDGKGLLPVITQCSETSKVLMFAYMNFESLKKTIDSGFACYWSRSRDKFWTKGETSGHLQKVKEIILDCDGDCLLLKVEQIGPACHTGEETCFFRKLKIS